MTTLRLSCHKLQIELGCHTQPKTVINQKKCDVCNYIEDEIRYIAGDSRHKGTRCSLVRVHQPYHYWITQNYLI